MARPEKVSAVEEIKKRIQENTVMIMTDYRGLTVNELSDLRSKLYSGGSGYKVYKNTLINIAVSENKALDGYSSMLTGPTAVAYHPTDPVFPAKVLVDFAKKNDKLLIKGGILENTVITEAKVKYLTSLPSREVLLAKLAGTLKAPITNLVYGLSALPKKLVYAVNAIHQSKKGNN